MRTFGSMEYLWLYLQSLPKNQKKWLLEKLKEDLAVEQGATKIKMRSANSKCGEEIKLVNVRKRQVKKVDQI